MIYEERAIFKNKYNDYTFWKKAERYDYTETMCEILKNLEFNYESEGGYSKKVLIARIEDNIDMIKRYCASESKAEGYFHMCFPGIALLCRNIELPDEFIKKYKVKPWHISLMRRTYFGIELDCEDFSYTKSNCEISLVDKRPYGNSDITVDIADEYFAYNKSKNIKNNGHTFKWSDKEVDFYDLKYEYVDKNKDFFWNIMDETNDIIRKMLKEVDYSHLAFVNVANDRGYYTYNWELCKSVIRNKKIEKLIGNE